MSRTRKRVIAALATLLTEVPYESITLAQIAEVADLARPSIYRLFTDKDAVLAEYFSAVFTEFEEEVQTYRVQATQTDEREIWIYRLLFRTLATHSNELRNFSRPETRALLFDAVWAYQGRLIEYAMEVEDHSWTSASELREVAVIEYQSGGCAAVVTEWIQQGMVISSDEMARLLMSIQEVFRGQQVYLPGILTARLRKNP